MLACSRKGKGSSLRALRLMAVALAGPGCSLIVDGGQYSVAPDEPDVSRAEVEPGRAPGDDGEAPPLDDGQDGNGTTPDVPGDTSGNTQGDDMEGDGQPLPTACTGNPPAPGCATSMTAPGDLERAQVEAILGSYCGACHGSALPAGLAAAGMNYIDDVDRLVETGRIVPLDPEGSRVVQRMRDGSMPPPESGLPRVPSAEIDIIAQFIDNPQFWPVINPRPPCSDQLFDFDALYRTVAGDLAQLNPADQISTRYLALTNRYTAGVCPDTSLDRDRQGMNKLVNALSTDVTIVAPVPINVDQTIYRIDLRDYGWDQAVTLANDDGSTLDFVNKWEAIARNNPYAVPFVGDDADAARRFSASDFPVMLADSMLDTASIGNLYYALIGVDVRDTLDNFILVDLGIDVSQNLIDADQVRAGTSRSLISGQDRVVQRDEIEIRNGVLWQVFDFADDTQGQSIFENPFGFAEDGAFAMFTLPNGMFGFIIADANGNIVEDSDILLDTNQNNFRAATSISCSNCHARGLIEVVDEVREIALANVLANGLDPVEVEQLRAVYPEAAEFARISAADTQTFYTSALARAALPTTSDDPISQVYFRFDEDMRLADAAGDLGQSPDELLRNLSLLQPELSALAEGVLDRDDFTQFYVDSLCQLQVASENAPSPDLCAVVSSNGGIVP
jgi:mono/diheme cytochrome c family protein